MLIESNQSPQLRLPTQPSQPNRMAEAMARHRDHYLALVQQAPEDWPRIEAIYGQVKRAWQLMTEEESGLAFIQALAMYQERRGLWQERELWIKRACNGPKVQISKQQLRSCSVI